MLTVDNLWIVIVVVTLVAIGITIWLVAVIIEKQKITLESDNIQNDLRSTIYRLKEEIDRSLETSEEHKIFSNQYKEAYEDERDLSTKLNQKNAIYIERIDVLNEKLDLLKEQWKSNQLKIDMLQAQLSNVQTQAKVLEVELDSEKKIHIEKIEQSDKNRQQMKMEFTSLADKILKNNSKEFSQQNTKNLTDMINPIRDQFHEFKKQIDDLYIKETKDRSMLQAEIKNIKEINLQMSKEANNLTNALKGESKTQGIWGEMILERVLENSGLKQGESYKREVALRHESDDSLYRPDVIVYLPDDREVVIDAKTSLTAYEQYVSSQDENLKKKFADQHIASMKRHIKDLSDKDYTNLKGVKTLDFIFMFIPVESALLMAMEYDSNIFEYAFKKNIILVGPTTLMVALRAVENSWKHERQRQNATEIAKRAGFLFDKFVGFVESVESLGKQINRVQKTYDDTYSKLHMGSGSLTSQFYKLEKLGAATSKKLPNHLLNEIES